MSTAIFKLADHSGTPRLAIGDHLQGPTRLLPADASLTAAIRHGGLRVLTERSDTTPIDDPASWRVVAPIDDQQVWAAGVTYPRSRDARAEESSVADVYDRVWVSERPELFLKATARGVVDPGRPVGIRADSTWDVPEPELGLVISPALEVLGYFAGNDMSSRSIEGENPLYLPQAKVYDDACALGPCLVPVENAQPPFEIHLSIDRAGGTITNLVGTTADMARTPHELAVHLGSCTSFPDGVYLLTGTCLVPEPQFTLRSGDVVRIEIEDVGVLTNPVHTVGAVLGTAR